MVKLSGADIKHVAKLAKLSLTAAEIKKLQKQLAKVIGYISQLNEVETAGVTPTSQTTGMENVFREDKIHPTGQLIPQEALSGTEKTQNDYFVVKQVISKNG